MAAYLLVTLNIADPSWLATYAAHVPAIIHKHGGAYSLVSQSIKRYEGGAPDPDAIVLFTFPSMEAIEAFLADPEYTPFKDARLAGSSGDMLGFTARPS